MVKCMSSTNIWLILMNGIISMCAMTSLPCHYFDSINITNGVQKQEQLQQVHRHDTITFDGIEFQYKQYAIVDYTEDDGMRNVTEPHLRGCFCKIKPCYRLCCSNEQITINNDTVKRLEHKCNEELNQLENEVYDESSKFINLLLGYMIINFESKTCLPFFVQEDYMNLIRQKQLNHGSKTLNSRGYCQTRIDKDTNIHMDVAICITSDEMVKSKITNPYESLDRIEHIAMIISMPFLIVTLMVYIYLPTLHRNLHGKCFICYLICQTACFVVETLNYYTNYTMHLDPIVVYLFLCSFQWLNVTAFDAWWNLRSFKSVSNSTKSSERKRLIVYILYTLLSPFALYAFRFGSDILKSAKVNPEQAEDLMRATFIGITFTINIVFFVLTTLKIRKVRNEMDHLTSQEHSARHQKKINVARGNFQLYLRLFIVMGLTYSISALSFMMSGSSAFSEWTEIFLSLQGVWIFVLFVLKRRVFRLIYERWNGIGNVSTSSM